MEIAIVLLLIVCVGLALAWGVLSVAQNLSDEGPYGEPTFRGPGPIFHDQHVGQHHAKSQFAWQSRSHSRAPD
jgi:hypothetical protein